MKDVIEKLEIILNQGLYGRDEEVRLALLCTLSNKPLLLYGHDDAKDIQILPQVQISQKIRIN